VRSHQMLIPLVASMAPPPNEVGSLEEVMSGVMVWSSSFQTACQPHCPRMELEGVLWLPQAWPQDSAYSGAGLAIATPASHRTGRLFAPHSLILDFAS